LARARNRADAVTRVLVVDDEPAILRVVRANLVARDYEVVTATTGEDAIALIATEAPDVVVLDLGLPDIDGLDVCARVREWTSVPILVLSADADDMRKVRALDAGADDYVTKPFSMPELLARIRVALRHHDQRPEGPDQSVLKVGDLVVDVGRHQVRVARPMARSRADPSGDPARGLGARLRLRDAVREGVREQPAKEAPG
jgi:two-component system KDP operon response regulator KdpE